MRRALEEHLAKHDPVLRAFLNIPEDDEPKTEEERATVAEAYDDLKAGRVIPWDEVNRELWL